MSNLCKICVYNGITADTQPCYSCYSYPHNPMFKANKNNGNTVSGIINGNCEICEAQMKQTPVEALVKYFMNCKFFICPICNRALFDSENYCPACGQRIKRSGIND